MVGVIVLTAASHRINAAAQIVRRCWAMARCGCGAKVRGAVARW